LLSKRGQKASAKIYTRQISPQLQLDLTKHNTQYETMKLGANSKKQSQIAKE